MTKGSKDPCATFTPSANGPRKLFRSTVTAIRNYIPELRDYEVIGQPASLSAR